MRVYDGFIFHDELDQLELRLNILDPFVDHFVVCEGDRTFRGKTKEPCYLKNRARFDRWADKLIHVLAELPTGDPWAAEFAQRDAIADGLVGAAVDDLVLVSDVDEIWAPSMLNSIAEASNNGAVKLGQRMFYYYLNLELVEDWRGSAAARKRHLRSPNSLRREEPTSFLPDAGWHFSYLGGTEAIRTKIQSFSHSELDTSEFTNLDHIERCMEQGIDLFGRPIEMHWVEIDDSFPKYIVKNQDQLRRHIRELP